MKKWYVVQTYSGYENSVIEDLESRKYTMGLEGKLFRLLAPEDVIEEERIDKKTGKKVIKTKTTKTFPGYIFLEMEVEKEIDDNTWFIIRNTPKVTGFLGSSGRGTKPVPIPQEEMKRILNKVDNRPAQFKIGDTVRITGGIFKDTTAVVTDVDLDKKYVTVLIEFFGRDKVPTEISFEDVIKC